MRNPFAKRPYAYLCGPYRSEQTHRSWRRERFWRRVLFWAESGASFIVGVVLARLLMLLLW